MFKLMKYDVQKYWMQYIVLFLVHVVCSVVSYSGLGVIPLIQGVCIIISYIAFLVVYIIFLKNNFGTLFDKNSALVQTLPLTHQEIILCKMIEGTMLIFLGMFVLTIEAILTYHYFQLMPGHVDSFYVLINYYGQPLLSFFNMHQFMNILIKMIVLTMVLLTIYSVWTLRYTSYAHITKICTGIVITAISFAFFVLANPQPTLTAYGGFVFPQYVGYAIVFYSILCFLLYLLIIYLFNHKLEL